MRRRVRGDDLEPTVVAIELVKPAFAQQPTFETTSAVLETCEKWHYADIACRSARKQVSGSATLSMTAYPRRVGT